MSRITLIRDQKIAQFYMDLDKRSQVVEKVGTGEVRTRDQSLKRECVVNIENYGFLITETDQYVTSEFKRVRRVSQTYLATGRVSTRPIFAQY